MGPFSGVNTWAQTTQSSQFYFLKISKRIKFMLFIYYLLPGSLFTILKQIFGQIKPKLIFTNIIQNTNPPYIQHKYLLNNCELKYWSGVCLFNHLCTFTDGQFLFQSLTQHTAQKSATKSPFFLSPIANCSAVTRPPSSSRYCKSERVWKASGSSQAHQTTSPVSDQMSLLGRVQMVPASSEGKVRVTQWVKLDPSRNWPRLQARAAPPRSSAGIISIKAHAGWTRDYNRV